MRFSRSMAVMAGVACLGTVGLASVAQSNAMTPVRRPALVSPAAPAPSAMEQAILTQVNAYRQSKGLSPLVNDSRITDQARRHSENMAAGRTPFGHAGFQDRVNAIAKVVPYQGAAENVAYNMGYKDPVTQAVQGWIKSTGHRQNMEGKYDLSGIGVAKNAKGEYYFTQVFIKKR
jgi:uncharacterized protein YkwD